MDVFALARELTGSIHRIRKNTVAAGTERLSQGEQVSDSQWAGNLRLVFGDTKLLNT